MTEGPVVDGARPEQPTSGAPSPVGVGLSRRAHVATCAALACTVVATDLLVEPVTPVLVVLICAGAIAGFLRPDGILAGGLIVGLAVPVVRFLAVVAGVDLATSSEPGGPVGALSLVFLVVPALFAAVIGGYARRTLEEERRRPR